MSEEKKESNWAFAITHEKIPEGEKMAYEELLAFLKEDEEVENIIFGKGMSLYEYVFVPKEYCNKLLTLEEAKPFLQNGWKFSGGYGGEECPETYIWTNKRVILVGIYDGRTWLQGIPRNPVDCEPEFCGG